VTAELDVLLKRLHLANARRVWRDMVQRAEKEQWTHDALLYTLFAEEVAHRRGTRLTRAVRAAQLPFLRTVEEFDFTYQSTLRLTTIGTLLSPDFRHRGQVRDPRRQARPRQDAPRDRHRLPRHAERLRRSLYDRGRAHRRPLVRQP
jgi:IstB-like ATP binding protein